MKKKKTIKCDYPDCQREAIRRGRFSNMCRKHLDFYVRHNPGVHMQPISEEWF